MPAVAYIHPDKCDQSPMCPARRMCPRGAISQEKGKGVLAFLAGGTSKVDAAKCTGCSVCLRYCPARAITMVPA